MIHCESSILRCSEQGLAEPGIHRDSEKERGRISDIGSGQEVTLRVGSTGKVPKKKRDASEERKGSKR